MVPVYKLSNSTIEKVKKYTTIPFEKFGNWIEAGSGNFEKTREDGRYRENCNSFHLSITCSEHIAERKKIYWHCGKLDCTTCFIEASSRKARIINERLLEFQLEAMKRGIRTGRLFHFTLSIKRELALKRMADYNVNFLSFRREVINSMLQDMGIFAGVIFTHIRSAICQKCGEREKNCQCETKIGYKKLNPHFHVIGYGYIMNAKQFKEKYPNFVYINHGRRDHAYHTIFYILSKVSLWRKENGKLKPSYNYFNWLSGKKLVAIRKNVRYHTDNCPICKKPRTIENSEYRREIGKIYNCKTILRSFRILDVEELRKMAQMNILRYREDHKEDDNVSKTGNGFG
jgi:hypothetical protein